MEADAVVSKQVAISESPFLANWMRRLIAADRTIDLSFRRFVGVGVRFGIRIGGKNPVDKRLFLLLSEPLCNLGFKRV